MRVSSHKWGFILLIFIVLSPLFSLSDWGFYGHKLINQQAVFSLPFELQQYFLPHLDFLTRHAVDPDKRRYAIKDEASQHYFDTEKWDEFTVDTLHYNRRDLLSLGPGVALVCQGDTSWVGPQDSLFSEILVGIPKMSTAHSWTFGECEVVDTMASHGLLPITISRWYYKLVEAFGDKDKDVLKVAADLGHYLGDAHVPLHTTVNYNGQLSGQLGIHAFWETHVPEALAERSFDLVSGEVDLIDDVLDEAWRIVRQSHTMVDSVLEKERAVRLDWEDEDEHCTRERLGRIAEVPCPALLDAYHEALDQMVERQMRRAIKSIASFWWSAYVEAGQPRLDILRNENKEDQVFKGRVQSRLVDCE
jgi:hypothetical protein